MEYTTANPFIPTASVVRYANSIFEARIHLPGAAAHVDIAPHQNFILVTGSLAPRVHIDADGKPSTLVFTDQPCGVFGRDIPVNLTHGTELVVLSTRQDCDDYIIRYTIRNAISPRPNCADYANAAASGSNVPAGVTGCGGAAGLAANVGTGPGVFVHPGFVHPGFVHPGVGAVPPALLGRAPGMFAAAAATPYGYGHGYGYGCAGYPAYNPHPYHFARGAGVYNPGYTPGLVFHPNGGATF